MTSDLESQILARKWFYEFHLPSGQIAPMYITPELEKIHKTREQMMLNFLQEKFGSDWSNLRCLDLSCHQGYFSWSLASKGFKEVVGIDVRQQNVDDAKLIQEVFSLNNLSFIQSDIFDLDLEKLGMFDVVLMFGLLYHLENPVGGLRVLRKFAKTACLIETQIAPNVASITRWGNSSDVRTFRGNFGVIDEKYELSTNNREANTTTISLVPSGEALDYLLRELGFSSVIQVKPPDDGYDLLLSGDRVMVAGLV